MPRESISVSDEVFGPGQSDAKDWAIEMGWDGVSEPPDLLPPDAVLFGMGPENEDEES